MMTSSVPRAVWVSVCNSLDNVEKAALALDRQIGHPTFKDACANPSECVCSGGRIYLVEFKVSEVYVDLFEKLNLNVVDLEVSARICQCFQNMRLQYVGDLVQLSPSKLLKNKNFGKQSLRELKILLAEMGLSLGMSIPWWWNSPENRARATAAIPEGQTNG